MPTSNLPIQLTSFVGREREIAGVRRMLGQARLVTLTGAGGSGKTRLAIEAVNGQNAQWTDGVWFVSLAPLREPELIPALVVQALGLRVPADQSPREHLLDFVQSRQLLLVLDNCEHLQDACAQLALELLSRATGLRILATSRAPLAIPGEAIYPVPGLALPAGTEAAALNLAELLRYDALRLFVERAKSTAPDFELKRENARAALELCRRLDGLPLALELASARVKVLTVQEIAGRLDDRFSLLVAGPRKGIDPRHQTLRAAIDWSYDLLSAEDQALLRHMAVFGPGCTLDMLEAVCADGHPAQSSLLEQVSSLVGKSLVIAETAGRTSVRYRLLETIREYALEKLDAEGETATLRNRHLDFYLARAEEVEPRLNESYQQLWLNWLEDEHGNIRLALQWAFERGSIEKGLRICAAVTRFWEIRGFVQEGLSWFERLLQKIDETVSPVVLANALSRAAFFAMFLNDPVKTTAFGKQAVAAAEAAGEEGKQVLTVALGAFSSGARVSGDFQTAYEIGLRGIRLLRESSGQPFLLCMSLISAGSCAIELGDFEGAHACLDEGLALAQADSDPFRTGMTWNILGDLARCERKYAQAEEYYTRSIALLRQINATRDLASVLRNLGHACLRLGNIDRAHRLFRESMGIQQTFRNMPGIAECLIGFAGVAIYQETYAAGARLLGASRAAVAGKYINVATAWRANRMENEHYLELARAALGESDFEAELAAGRSLSLDQAIDFALTLPLRPKAAPPSEETAHGLTGREREIAGLIGQGKTNGEIAETLVLSKRTVETHFSHILSKLGFSSRAQIIRWAMERELSAS